MMSAILLAASTLSLGADAPPAAKLHLAWADNILTIKGPQVPGGELKIWYLEAYCRPGSTARVWDKTVIPHTTELLEAAPDGSRLRLRCQVSDGVVVEHTITASADEVTFDLRATNPTNQRSEIHWAQPCVRVDRFVGLPSERNSEAYLPKCFLLIDGKPAWMPTMPWARQALYTPGQVWCPAHVDRNDVNPRPLSELVPSHGLIGCVSGDGTKLFATAWEPYQELFQGIIVCLHADFRVGGLAPGESRTIRGKVYIVDNDIPALQARYLRDFPEHEAKQPRPQR